jgi:hypothetical protein
MIRTIIPVVALAALANSAFAQNADQTDIAREKIQKWVETRQVISKETADWKVQKESMQNTLELLKQEMQSLETRMKEIGDTASQADVRRSELTDQKNKLSAATDSVRIAVADLEDQIKQILPMFPDALRTLIDPLVRRMPADSLKPGKLTLGERLPNVVGILNQANKFNTTIHYFSEIVKLSDGTEKQVNVLYWGLGIAYFVDQTGEYAGYKYPTKDGWKAQEMPEIAVQVRSLVDMYQRKNPNIEFVSVPVVIK